MNLYNEMSMRLHQKNLQNASNSKSEMDCINAIEETHQQMRILELLKEMEDQKETKLDYRKAEKEIAETMLKNIDKAIQRIVK